MGNSPHLKITHKDKLKKKKIQKMEAGKDISKSVKDNKSDEVFNNLSVVRQSRLTLESQKRGVRITVLSVKK